MIRVVLNGEPREVPDTVGALLVEMRAPAEGVAVAVNGEVVPRRERGAWVLREGDRVEIIRAVGGG